MPGAGDLQRHQRDTRRRRARPSSGGPCREGIWMREVVGSWGWRRTRRLSAAATRTRARATRQCSRVWTRSWLAPRWPWRSSGADSLGFTRTRSGSSSYGARCGRRTWAHIAQVARAARGEAPEVPQKFVFRPGINTHVALPDHGARVPDGGRHGLTTWPRHVSSRPGCTSSMIAERSSDGLADRARRSRIRAPTSRRPLAEGI
jgi:hypothetical protein